MNNDIKHFDSCDINTPKKYVLEGYYFTSKYKDYIITTKVINEKLSILVKLYEFTKQNDSEYKNGDLIRILKDYNTEFICSIEMWPKYFFIKQKGDRQMYYPSTFYGEKDDDDDISSICDAIHFAIGKGFEISEIKPY